MRARALMVAVAVGLAALGACREHGATEPPRLQQDDGPGAGGDSTRNPTPVPASVDLSGQVLVVERIAPPGVNGDTLRRTPLARAGIALQRRVVVDGTVSLQLVGRTTTDAQGEWTFDDIPGGYYALEVTPPAASGLAPVTYDVSAIGTTVVFLAHIWKP